MYTTQALSVPGIAANTSNPGTATNQIREEAGKMLRVSGTASTPETSAPWVGDSLHLSRFPRTTRVIAEAFWRISPTLALGIGTWISVRTLEIYHNFGFGTASRVIGVAIATVMVSGLSAMTFELFRFTPKKANVAHQEKSSWRSIAVSGSIYGVYIGLPAAVGSIVLDTLAIASMIFIALSFVSVPVVVKTGGKIRRWSLTAVASSISLVACVLMSIVLAVPLLDHKIDYYRPDRSAFAALSRYSFIENEDSIKPSFENTPVWQKQFADLLDSLERARNSSEALLLAHQLDRLVQNVSLRVDGIDRSSSRILIQFLENPQTTPGISSFAVRETVYYAKLRAFEIVTRPLYAKGLPETREDLENDLRLPDEAINWKRSFGETDRLALIELLGRLSKYQEIVNHKDLSFPPSLPFTEAELLSERLRHRSILLLSALANPDGRERLPDRVIHHPLNNFEKAVAVVAQREIHKRALAVLPFYYKNRMDGVFMTMVRPFQRYEEYEKAMNQIGEARRMTEVPIPLHYVDAVREIRGWPPALTHFMTESAQRHGLSIEDLGAFLIETTFNDNTYPLWRSIDAYEARRSPSQHRKAVLDWARDVEIGSFRPGNLNVPNRWNDFAGFLSGAQTTVGPFQFRASTVRNYRLWERIGVDADRLSDLDISVMLLDPKYAAEAAAAFLDTIAAETEQIRLKAVDVSSGRMRAEDFDKVIQTYQSNVRQEVEFGDISFTWETYLQIPSLEKLGDQKWILGGFHPVYHQKVYANMRALHAIVASQINGSKPGFFTEIATIEDVNTLGRLASNHSEMPYLRHAALVTLQRLATSSSDSSLAQHAKQVLSMIPDAMTQPRSSSPAPITRRALPSSEGFITAEQNKSTSMTGTEDTQKEVSSGAAAPKAKEQPTVHSSVILSAVAGLIGAGQISQIFALAGVIIFLGLAAWNAWKLFRPATVAPKPQRHMFGSLYQYVYSHLGKWGNMLVFSAAVAAIVVGGLSFIRPQLRNYTALHLFRQSFHVWLVSLVLIAIASAVIYGLNHYVNRLKNRMYSENEIKFAFFHRLATMIAAAVALRIDNYFLDYRDDALHHLHHYFAALDWINDITYPFMTIQVFVLIAMRYPTRHRISTIQDIHLFVAKVLTVAKFVLPMLFVPHVIFLAGTQFTVRVWHTGTTFDIQDIAAYLSAVVASFALHTIFLAGNLRKGNLALRAA
jgi:hypothetical protein